MFRVASVAAGLLAQSGSRDGLMSQGFGEIMDGADFSVGRFLFTRCRYKFECAGSFSRVQDSHQIGERQRRELTR